MVQVLTSDKLQIAVVGKQNAGKSSLVNALLGQDLCDTSHLPGTAVNSGKNITNLLAFGPVVLVDTAGIDHSLTIKEKNLNHTIKALSTADFAIVVLNAPDSLDETEKKLFTYLNKISLPHLIVVNKVELGINTNLLKDIKSTGALHFEVSCKENAGIDRLKSKLIRMLPDKNTHHFPSLVMKENDVILLVIPENDFNSEQNLIIPVKQALNGKAVIVTAKEKDLAETLSQFRVEPNLVITRDNFVKHAAACLPPSSKITTYSIMLALYNGNLNQYIQAISRVNKLQEGDTILAAEACNNHPQNGELIKISDWAKNKNISLDFIKSDTLPEDLPKYSLVVNCNGCAVSKKEMCTRTREAQISDVPITTYGILLNYLNGNMPRVISPFIEAANVWLKVNKPIQVI